MMDKIIIISLLLFIIPIVAYAEKLTAYVTDNAGLLTPEQENLLSTHIETMEKSTGYEIAIVTVQTTNGDDRFWFAYELGEGNGVGKAETDNGIVILWSVEDEKGGAIATGRGAEVAVTDADVNRIGRASREYFDEEQYYEAFVYILDEIGKEISQETFANAPSGNNQDIFNNLWVWIILGIFIMWLFGVGMFASTRGSYESTRYSAGTYKPTKSRRKRKDDDDDDSFIAGAVVGSSIGSGGWSGGGGFGGFGGGSFGGGGSSF